MAQFVPSPSSVVKERFTGTGDMGDVANDDDPVRFGLDVDFVLVLCRFWASGGTGFNDIQLKQKLTVDEDPSELFNERVRKFLSFGAGTVDGVPATDHHDFRVQSDENAQWTWLAGTFLVPEYTNPDPGNIRWKWEIWLAPNS